MKVKESHEIIIDQHPYHETLNTELIKDAGNADYGVPYAQNAGASHIHARMSAYTTRSRSIDLLSSWMRSLLYRRYSWLSKEKIEICNTWFNRYDVDDYATSHDHIPFPFSFNYFIKCPKGAAPFVFTGSGKRIKPEEGKVIIFPSCIRHHVPKNKCKDRIVLAGDIALGSNFYGLGK